MKKNRLAGFLCINLSLCIAMSSLPPVLAAEDASSVYAAEAAAEVGIKETRETEEKAAQDSEPKKGEAEETEIKETEEKTAQTLETTETENSEPQGFEPETETTSVKDEADRLEEAIMQAPERGTVSESESETDMPEESSAAEIDNGAADSGFFELEPLLEALRKKYANMHINSSGHFEYTDEGGKTYTYDPYDPELCKYLLGEDAASYEDGSGNLIDSYEDSSKGTKSPFTGGTYSHESHVSNKIIQHGIDVSKYQKDIDWDKAARAGVYFAFVRVGYRSYATGENEGKIGGDEYAAKNIKAASDAGVKVGVYFFSQAITEAEAKEEADYTIKFLKDNGLENRISLPIMIDYEYASYSDGKSGRLKAANLSKNAHQDICDRFVKAVRDNGFKGGIYANYSMLTNDMQPASSSFYNSTDYWIARYNTRTGYSKNYIFWQYSSSGSVDGISGRVDCDFWYQDKISISKCRISLESGIETDYVDDMKEALSVYDAANKRRLIEDKDYTLTVTQEEVKDSEEKITVSYSFVITGMGDYTGRVEKRNITRSTFALLSASMISDIAPQEYTGLEITQETGLKFEINNGNALLAEGKDYTVAYSDNIGTGTGYVIVTGIGHYTGEVKKPFKIKAKNLTAEMFEDIPDVSYTGSNRTTGTGVKIKGINKNIDYELKENEDYTVKYSSNKNMGEAKAYITGKGKYAGKVTLKFNIVTYDFSNDAKVILKYDKMTYTGKPLKPAVTVMLNGKKLSGSDYTVTYSDNVDIGDQACVTVKGRKNCAGEKKEYFSIIPKPIKRIKLTSRMVSLENTHMYAKDGEPVEPEVYVVSGAKRLEKGIDYEVTYQDKRGTAIAAIKDVGEYKIIVSGMGAYTGKITKKIIIAERNLKFTQVTITSAPESLVYTGKAVPVEIDVKDRLLDDARLEEGKDYNVSYIDNKNAGKARVVIKGKGEYKGEAVKYFDILPKDITDNAAVSLNKDYFVYNGKKQQPSVKVKDGRTALKLNRDFRLRFAYNAADPENAQDATETECKDAGKYTVNIEFIGNYKGTAAASYEIAKADFGKVKTSVKNQNYTGTNVSPSFDKMTVKLGNAVLDKDALNGVEIGGYRANKDVGTAGFNMTATAECKNFQNGTNAVNFKIVKRQMKDLDITIGGAAVSDKNKCALELVYNDGSAYNQSNGAAVVVKDAQADRTLVENTDYEVYFSNNRDAGNAKVQVKGIGGYSGFRTIYFKIAGKPIDENFNIKFTKGNANGDVGYIYNTAEHKPALTFSYGSLQLRNGRDYTVKYENNVNAGDARAVVVGKGNYLGTMSKKFYIFPKMKTAASIITVSSIPDQKYTGKVIVPSVAVTFDGVKLVQGKDYTISVLNSTKLTYPSDKKNKGTATVIITGIGNYRGTLANSSFTVVK